MKNKSMNESACINLNFEESFRLSIMKIGERKKCPNMTFKTLSEPRPNIKKELSTNSPLKSNVNLLPLIDTSLNNKKVLDETIKSLKMITIKNNNSHFLNNKHESKSQNISPDLSEITCFKRLKNELLNKTNQFTLRSLIPLSLSPIRTHKKNTLNPAKKISSQKTIRKNSTNFFLKKTKILNFDEEQKYMIKRQANDVIKINQDIKSKFYYRLNKKMSLSEILLNENQVSKSSKIDSLFYMISNKNE